MGSGQTIIVTNASEPTDCSPHQKHKASTPIHGSPPSEWIETTTKTRTRRNCAPANQLEQAFGTARPSPQPSPRGRGSQFLAEYRAF